MPIAQITVNVSNLTEAKNAWNTANKSASQPFTVYAQVNISGRYKCRLLGINWCDTLSVTTIAANNVIVTLSSNTWSFPGSGQRGYSFSNKTDHIQQTSADTPYWEVLSTGAIMDIQVAAVQSTDAAWSVIGFQFLILTLDLEKIQDMA
jgi:hypothetical protein